jgi:hypothetical protein
VLCVSAPHFSDVTTLLRYEAKPKFTRHLIAEDDNLTVWQTNSMKALVCLSPHPPPPDNRHSIAVFDGSNSSPACPSDKGSIFMSRGFGGGKKINKIFSDRQSRRSVKMLRHLGEYSVSETTEYFYTLMWLSARKFLLKNNTRIRMNKEHLWSNTERGK